MIRPTLEKTRGDYRIRVAQTNAEVKAAFSLRYKVYYEEKGANCDEQTARLQQDKDQYDDYATQIIVEDLRRDPSDRVIATHRLIFDENIPQGKTFYTAQEFDCQPLFSDHKKLMEIGRVAIHPEYRSGTVLSMIWKYTMALIKDHGVERMFGCGSFTGDDPDKHAHVLSYLYYNHLAPKLLDPVAKAPSTKMNLLKRSDVDDKKAQESIPPLMRGYLRLGGVVSSTAFIDKDFHMVDTCIFVDTSTIPSTTRLNRVMT